MEKNKIIGMSLLVLAALTVIGMIANSNGFWIAYNYITIMISVAGGLTLLRSK